MSREEIEKVFRMMAQGQGFYGRLLRIIENCPENQQNQFYASLEAQKFKTDLDVILYIEGHYQ